MSEVRGVDVTVGGRGPLERLRGGGPSSASYARGADLLEARDDELEVVLRASFDLDPRSGRDQPRGPLVMIGRVALPPA